MGELFRHLTRRGRWLLGLGTGTFLIAAVLGQRDLMRIGVLLLVLPLLCALLLVRTRYRLSAARGLRPARISVDGTATSVVRLQNVSRLHTGLLLLEDRVPWQLGRSPRFVVDRLVGATRRDVRYDLRASLRGRYEIGPLQVQLVDPFGLCRLTRQFATTEHLTVLPQVHPLPGVPLTGDWSGLGDSATRAVASLGEDDVVPREYRTGDELRRVHWKSTARSGELMVRREERPWRTRATVLLDTREVAHRGDGPASTFEWAVTAAASVSVHLVRRGYAMRLLDLDARPLARDGAGTGNDLPALEAEGPMLDALAVVTPSQRTVPGITDATVRERARDGLLVALLADLDPAHAERMAGLRQGRATAVALLADTDQWPGPRRTPDAVQRRARTVAILRGHGWRVVVCAPGDDLASAWRSLAGGHTPTGSRLR
jgi:uncharacterized protein (DUF58 family)